MEFAILLIRPERLRQINISHGYEVGNQVIQLVYDQLVSINPNANMVHRISGPVYLFVIQKLHSQGHASLAAMKINRAIEKQLSTLKNLPALEVNIGIAVYPDHGQTAETLFSHAEIALKEARSSMESCRVYNKHHKLPLMNWDLGTDLESAIDNDQLELVFQPQISFENNRVIGAEALLRWHHPDQGVINTEHLINYAEQNHLIADITDWSIRNALWHTTQLLLLDDSLKISVNLSPKAMEAKGLVDSLVKAARIFDANLSHLTLEVTESALMDDVPSKIEILEQLKSEGVKISIDDFGTGYSSMEYLKMLPADELKIDKSFVMNMLENDMDLHIVHSIIEMASGFGLTVVAEGVGDLETFQTLQSMGCNIGQGFYISEPLSQDKLLDWISQYSEVCELLN